MRTTTIAVVLFLLASPAVAGTPRPMPIITIEGTRFVADGKEFKIWGFNLGHGLNLTDEQLRDQVDQLAFLGANMMRLHTIDWTMWGEAPGADNEPLDSGLLPRHGETTRGVIHADNFYRQLNAFREKGIYVAITLSVARHFVAGDADVLTTDNADRKAWSDAVAELNRAGDHVQLCVFKILPVFDERSAALRKEFATQLLSLVNPVTGVKLAEDPQLALLNTVNECSSCSAFHRDVSRYPMPAYFRDKVARRWSEYLRAKYTTDEALAAAWKEDGKRGLLEGESLAAGGIQLLPVDASVNPLATNETPFSETRQKDFIEFLVNLDMRHQREMAACYRSAGWTRPCGYSDTVGYDGDTGPLWMKTDMMPYVEDHPYDEANIGIFHWGWLRIPLYSGATFLGPEGADRPHWGSEINAGAGWVSETRIPFLLFVAAYHSLQGRDGLAWHVWSMKRADLILATERANLIDWASMNHDVPELFVWRAAGRLFKSCEIKPLDRNDDRLKYFVRDACIKTDQVERVNGENGFLRIKTDHFRCLAAPKAIKYDFGDVVLDLTADTWNVVVVEKLSDNECEITAVGKTGAMKEGERYMRFEPLEFVAGTATFAGREITAIDHVDHRGHVIETVPGHGPAMPFVHSIRLYRVRLK